LDIFSKPVDDRLGDLSAGYGKKNGGFTQFSRADRLMARRLHIAFLLGR
jgi:hypothetical protein